MKPAMLLLILKGLISGAVVVTVSELAKKNNLVASIIHSLPLTSLLAFIWLYADKKDAALVGQHAWGTFWFVLPTLPMFLLMPWLIKTTGGFWQALAAGVLMSVLLYFLTMRLLKAAGVNL